MSIKKLLLTLSFVALFLIPFSAAEAFVFGAKVITPPIGCSNGGYMVKAASVFGGSINLIYRPGASKVYLFGPPKLPGQWTLGTWRPSVCVVSDVPIPGQLIDRAPGAGTSL